MRPPVDLHIHSTFSDGICTVTDICVQVVKNGVQTFALSDHDTTDGLAPIIKVLQTMEQQEQPIQFIPAIELSSGENGLTHVLGYGVQDGLEPLQSELITLQRKRMERNTETIRLLNRILQTELMPETSDQTIQSDTAMGRMHVARMLIEKQFVKSVDEAFQKYLGVGKPAYLPLEHVTTADAIQILRETQAIPVLAHPMRINRDRTVLEPVIKQCKDNGLLGMEVFHPSASRGDVKWLYDIAKKYELLITGGSDFHGDWGMRSKVGKYPPGWHTWQQDLNALQAAIQTAVQSHTKGDLS